MTDNNLDNSKVVDLVSVANKPKSKGNKEKSNQTNKTDSGNGGGILTPSEKFGSYSVINGCFYLNKGRQTPDGYVENQIKLCNFTAKIFEEIEQDTGLENKAVLRIQATRQDGMTLPIVDVASNKFFAKSSVWVHEVYGTKLLIEPGSMMRDHVGQAIQRYSMQNGDIPSSQIFCFTGWKKFSEQWHYLTGSGAINADGLQDSIQTDLGAGHMGRYKLPPPFKGDQLKQSSALALELLNICPAKPFIGAALLATVARAPLGECKEIDFCLFLHGQTGTRKSSITALALAFFGAFNGNTFPGNWSDSDSDLEAKAFQAKDALFIVDDFKPSVNQAEASKLHSKSERFVRNTGNLAGRGRRNTDMTAKAAPYNRSMTIITGEDLPRGQSLLGRLLILELTREDVHLPTLSKLQKAAREGSFSGLMAAYIHYLAPRLDALKTSFPALILQSRDEVLQQGFASSHGRAPEIYANLVAGAECLLNFLTDVGALPMEQNNVLLYNLQDSLKQAFVDQAIYQAEQDECERFMSLLRALFNAGNAHVAGSLKQDPPELRPHSWGWRKAEIRGIDATFDQYSPMGDCIGWYCAKDREIWLDPEATFSKIQTLARNQGEAFLISAQTLWNRLGERGMIIKSEPTASGKRHYKVYRNLLGGRRRVVVLSADVIEGIE